MHADIRCGKVQLSKPQEVSAAIYSFKATVTCDITDASINVDALKDSYRDEITNKKSPFKVHDQRAYDGKNDMSGYWFDATQYFSTNHGKLTARAHILLLANNKDKFYQEFKSTSTHGEGDTQYNQSILNQVTLEVSQNSAKLTINKEIAVREPWFAPHSMFVNTVQEDLVTETNKAAQSHAQKIIGKNVEALR